MKYLFIGLVMFVASAAVGAPPKNPTPEERKNLEEEWKSFMSAGSLHARKGNVVEAQNSFKKALETGRQMFPAADFPTGHPILAVSLYSLGRMLAASEDSDGDAEILLRDSIKMTDDLYENDNENKILGRMELAQLLHRQGNLAEARKLYEKALEIAGRLYQKDNPLTAAVVSSLGSLLIDQGDLYAAELKLTAATAMYRRLYPKTKFPNGAPPLAGNLSNLGQLLAKEGKLVQGEHVLRESLEMFERLFKQNSPYRVNVLSGLAGILEVRGKLEEAESLFNEALRVLDRLGIEDSMDRSHCLNNLATVYMKQKRFHEAESAFRNVLRIRTRLLKGDDFRIALVQNNLGSALSGQGKYAEAATLYQRTLEMQNRLAKEGHADTALTLQNLASLRWNERKYAEAGTLYHECLQMTRGLVTTYAIEKSEGEALTLLTSIADRLSLYLTNALASNDPSVVTYSEIWSSKASVTRVFERRRLSARAASNTEASSLVENLSTRRLRRAELLLTPPSTNAKVREKRLEELRINTEEISKLESELRRLLPEKHAADELAKATPKDLQKAIPADAAIVDFLRFTLYEHDVSLPGMWKEKSTDHYIAFVITKEKISHINLGPAEPIESALALWCEGIRLGKQIPTELSAKVRELLWAKVREEIPKQVNVVYLVPDMALCQIPWAALPGDLPQSILIEDFAIAVIPHAVFLLDKLLPQAQTPMRPSRALIVGGAIYDSDEPMDRNMSQLGVPPLKSGQGVRWKWLPGAEAEALGVANAAERMQIPSQTLKGKEATVAAALEALPKVQYAHFATHGFFTSSSFRSGFQLDSKNFEITPDGERIGGAALSPLVMTGLVFAGANNPITPGRGVATGEALVDLDLSGLKLAVLSACETGIGTAVAGEGTFGLQRAFHLAGTRDVIASLWKVSDESTCALMAAFYRNLWARELSLSPIEALRQAQLEICRNPVKVSQLARDFRAHFEVVKGQEVEEETLKPGLDGKAHPRYWAAFILSGPGR